jgi:hypothetical protein
MKLSLYCLTIALVLRGAFDFVTAQDVVTPTLNQVGAIDLNRPWDNTPWLAIRSHNTERDWHPSFTSIVVEYKPLVKKLSDGRYEITFTSEIAEDLP